MFQNITFYYIFDQINAGLVNIRNYFFKTFL